MEKKRLTNTIDSSSQQQNNVTTFDSLLHTFASEHAHPICHPARLSIVCNSSATILSGKRNKSIHSNKENHPNNKYCRCLVRFSGILYAFTSSLLFTSSNFIMQQLDVVLLDVFLVRFFIQGLISIAFFIYKGYHPFSNTNNLFIFIRSVIAAIASVSFYYGLLLLPLPDLTTLRYTQVVWTALLVLIIFRQRINIPIVIASMLTLVGVAGVAQPSFLFSKSKSLNETLQISLTQNNNKRIIGISIALLCAFSTSMAIILNKKLLEKKVRQSIILFHFILTTFTLLLINQTYYWTFSKTNPRKFNFQKQYLTMDFLFATTLATLQLIPMILLQKSVKLEHPSIVTVVQASDILIAIILQNMFLKVKSNGIALLGSTLVLTSIIIVGGHKFWQDRKTIKYRPSSIDEK